MPLFLLRSSLIILKKLCSLLFIVFNFLNGPILSSDNFLFHCYITRLIQVSLYKSNGNTNSGHDHLRRTILVFAPNCKIMQPSWSFMASHTSNLFHKYTKFKKSCSSPGLIPFIWLRNDSNYLLNNFIIIWVKWMGLVPWSMTF